MTAPITTATTEKQRLFGDLSKPSLVALSYCLRHPETWPEDFVWDYSKCQQCAMGLAHQLWSQAIPAAVIKSNDSETIISLLAKRFSMSYTDARDVFFDATCKRHVRITSVKTSLFWTASAVVSYKAAKLQDITPDMIADDIDAILRKA